MINCKILGSNAEGCISQRDPRNTGAVASGRFRLRHCVTSQCIPLLQLRAEANYSGTVTTDQGCSLERFFFLKQEPEQYLFSPFKES